MRDLLGDIRGRALWVVLGCLVCQMGLGFGYGMGSLAPHMLAELGWSRAVFSSAQAPQLFVIAFASPLVGVLAARCGARVVLAVSAVVLAGGYLGIAAMQGWWQYAVAWGVVGLAVTGLGDIAVGAVVAQWVTRRRGLALGIVYTGSNLGGTLAARGMAALAEAASWRVAVAAAAASALGVLLPAAWFAVRDRTAGGAESAPEGERAEPVAPALELRAALRTRSFWILCFSLLGFWAYFLTLLQHFVLSLVDRGMPRESAAGHLANSVFIGLFSKIAFGFIADRLSAKGALLLDYGLLALSSLLLLALPGAWPLWGFVLVFGFSFAARDVVTPLAIVHCFGSRHLAQIYGVLMLTILPGGTLGPILAGWTHDETGSYTQAFGCLAAFNLASFLLLLAVRDERRPERD